MHPGQEHPNDLKHREDVDSTAEAALFFDRVETTPWLVVGVEGTNADARTGQDTARTKARDGAVKRMVLFFSSG